MLHKAARLGSIDVIRHFVYASIADGRPIDFLDGFDADGVTPLHMAIIHGRVDSVEGLLQLGSDPSIPCNGIPVLHLAITYAALPHKAERMQKILGILVEGGAPLTAKDEEGRTIFHYMAKYHVDPAIMEACCRLETVIQLQGRNGQKLPPTAFRDHMLSQADVLGDTAIHVAAKWGKASALQTLLGHVSECQSDCLLRRVNAEGNTPLHIAAMQGHAQVAAILFRLDPSCSAVLNLFGKNAFELARDHGHSVAPVHCDPNAEGRFQGFMKGLKSFLESGPDPRPEDATKELQEVCLPTWIVTSQDFRRHKTFPDHCKLKALPPENNRRWSVLAGADNGILNTYPFSDLCWQALPQKAHAADVLKVHEFGYFDTIRRRCAQLPPDNSVPDLLDGDTAISHDTFGCALLAAGCVCEAVDIVMTKRGRNAFCVVRPPGHHAGYRGRVGCPNVPVGTNGFCIFNNVVIGAAYALDVYRHAGLKRVAILDFDVHHGNGTEECVMNTVEHRDTERLMLGEEDEMTRVRKVWHPWLGEDDQHNIFFASVQGYGKHGEMEDTATWFYPGSGRSRDNSHSVEDRSEIEFDEGQAFPRVINVGVVGPGQRPFFWKECWRTKILPAVVEFEPDLILLSAGFDAHRRDEINGGFIGLESHHYDWLTQKLTEVANRCCDGRIVSVLEGGYAVQGGAASAFASSVAAHVAALNGKTLKKWSAAEAEIEREMELQSVGEPSVEKPALRTIPGEGPDVPVPLSNGADVANLPRLERLEAEPPSEDQRPVVVQSGRSKRRRKEVDYVALNSEMEKEASQIL